MRRVFPIIAALVILLSCAVPAFASSDGSGRVYYASIPFQYITVNGNGISGGPYEWVMAYGNIPTEQTVYFSMGGTQGYGGQIRDGKYYGQISGGSAGLVGYFHFDSNSITLSAKNVMIQTDALNYGYSIGLNDGTGFIRSLSITATAVVPVVNESGKYVVYEQTSSKVFTLNGLSVNVASCLLEVLEQLDYYYFSNYVFLTDLKVTVTGSYEVSETLHEWKVSCPFNALNTQYPSFTSWLEEIPNGGSVEQLPPTAGESDGSYFGDFLGGTISAFLNTELFPGFSFGTIFYIVLAVGILLWFITLLI